MNNTKPIYLLLIGALLIALTHMRFGLGILVFFESIPFLIYLDRQQNVRSHAMLYLALFIGWSLATAKIISDPIPWIIVFGYSLPISIFKYLPLLGYSILRDHKYAAWLFPALMVVGEWLQASFTPFASWGSAAYTQLNNLAWLQIVSLGGIYLLSFALYFVSYQLYQLIRNGYSGPTAIKILLPLLVLSLFGTMRLALAENRETESVLVAAVGTNSTIGGPIMPSAQDRRANRHKIYSRMESAAQAGARLIVWTEAGAGLLAEEESSFQSQVSQLTDSLNITAVVSYVVLESMSPFHYQNKYILIDSTGTVQSVYHKHEPVPGEPATPGTKPHVVYDMSGTKVGGAICYDLDFPDLGRAIASAGADVVAVPSSDWRGIDPLHTQMAVLRAIEGGYSLVRSTRWGLSAIAGPYGRVRGQLSDFNSDDKILISTVPKNGVSTLYTVLGDWVIALSLSMIVLVSLQRVQKKRRS